jgi:hypothetical protein
MKIFLFYLFLLTILNVFSPCLSKKLKKNEQIKFNFYNKIITNNNIQVRYDEENKNIHNNKFYITNNLEDYRMNSELISINPKQYIINGCKFFPFRDLFTKLLVGYGNITGNMNKNILVPIYSLIYQMLYYRYGNADASMKYYKDKYNNDYESEFFNFSGTKEELEYMKILLTPDDSININSSFFYSEDEINFADKLGLEPTKLKISNDVYGFVEKNIKGLQDGELKKILLDFISQEESFKFYADLVFRRGVKMNTNEFGNIYNKSTYENEYLKYHQVLKEKNNYENKFCYVLIPVVDLFQHIDNDNGELIHLKVDIKSYKEEDNQKLIISIDSNFKKDTPMGFSYHSKDDDIIYKTNEKLYLDHGIYNKINQNSLALLPYTFEKRKMSVIKAQICYLFGCGNFDIKFFMEKSPRFSMEHFFILKNNKSINNNLLNILKLIEIDDRKLDVGTHSLLFQQNKKLDYNIESRALKKYIQIMKKQDKATLEYVCIILTNNFN